MEKKELEQMDALAKENGEKEAKEKRRFFLRLFIAAAAVLLLFGSIWYASGSGWKTVSLTVESEDGKKQYYSVRTKADTLLEAMREIKGLDLEGITDSAGFLILKVNGEAAGLEDSSSFWLLYRDSLATAESPDRITIGQKEDIRLVWTAVS